MFFALWPDAHTQAKLGQCAQAMHRACGGKRMRTANLHITIAFLGQVRIERINELVAAASGVPQRPFSLRLDKPGFWKHNRIAWLGAQVVPDELAAMVGNLRTALRVASFPFDEKAFVPHVTVARNAHAPMAWPALEPVVWQVIGSVLVSSERDEAGVAYRIAAGPFGA